jgi:site-specific DNA-methyltransferase (adenine-specific)
MNLNEVTVPTWPCRLIQADYNNPPQVLGNPGVTADLTFADPPYNQGVKYNADPTKDRMSPDDYKAFTRRSIRLLANSTRIGGTLWWMTTEEHADWTGEMLSMLVGPRLARIVWHEAFAQYQGNKGLTKDFRFIFVHEVGERKNPIWNPDAIRVPSARQMVYKDKRANSKGRVPGTTWTFDEMTTDQIVERLAQEIDKPENADRRWHLMNAAVKAAARQLSVPDEVWMFRRLQGTSHDHVDWHPCQLPPELLERIVQGWSNPGSVVLDGFAGSGSLAKVCKRLGRAFVGVDRSATYNDEMFKELS